MPDRFHNEGGYEIRQATTEEMKEFLQVEGYVFGETETVTDEDLANNPLKPTIDHRGLSQREARIDMWGFSVQNAT